MAIDSPTSADLGGDSRRIASYPVDHRRGERIEKMQADEEQPRLIPHDASVVLRFAVGSEHRQVDPRKPGMESGAPDHIGDVEHAPIRQKRQSISHADHAPGALNPRRVEILRLHPDERSADVQDLRPHRTAERRGHGQDAMEEHAQNEPNEQPARQEPVDPERYMAGIAASQPRLVAARDFERDLCARVTCPDEQHAAGPQL